MTLYDNVCDFYCQLVTIFVTEGQPFVCGGGVGCACMRMHVCIHVRTCLFVCLRIYACAYVCMGVYACSCVRVRRQEGPRFADKKNILSHHFPLTNEEKND